MSSYQSLLKRVTETEFRQADIDENGHVGFETTQRRAYMAQRALFVEIYGTPYEQLKEENEILVVRYIEAIFRQEIQPGKVRITTNLTKIRWPILQFHTEMHPPSAENGILFQCKSTLVYIVKGEAPPTIPVGFIELQTRPHSHPV